MTLVLRIDNMGEALPNGEPSEIRIERHRLMIGRDDGGRADWRLPDPQRTVSAEHALVEYRDGTYFLQDVSRNGLFVNGDYQRLAPREHLLGRGDRIIVGPYDIVVIEGPEHAPLVDPYGGGYGAAPPQSQEWGGWAAPITNPHEIAPVADLKSFGREPPKPVFQSGGAMLGSFSAPAPPPGGDVWGKLFGAETGAGGPPWGAPVAPVVPAPAAAAPAWAVPTPVATTTPVAPANGAWGAPTAPSAQASPVAAPLSFLTPVSAPEPSPAPAPVSAAQSDMASAPPAQSPPAPPSWMVAAPASAEPNLDVPVVITREDVDPEPTEVSAGENALSLSPSMARSDDTSAPLPAAAPVFVPSRPQPSARIEPPAQAEPPMAADPSLSPDKALAAFLEGAGLPADAFGNVSSEEALAAAGARYRALVEGLVRMMEARARAKHELGVRSTVYAKNPLKFLQGPQAAQALIQPIGIGYLEGGAAVQEAFTDLQAHQIAMMLGMREAVRATVARFGPEAIEKRAGAKGLLGSIIPGQRKAQLYDAYEKEWEALAGSSDEAFLDVFAKAFRQAYDQVSGTGG